MLFHSVLNNNMVAFVESPATDTYYYKYFILRVVTIIFRLHVPYGLKIILYNVYVYIRWPNHIRWVFNMIFIL